MEIGKWKKIHIQKCSVEKRQKFPTREHTHHDKKITWIFSIVHFVRAKTFPFNGMVEMVEWERDWRGLD